MFEKIIDTIDSWIWGIPLIVLIMAVGIVLSVRSGFVQVRKLPKALKYIFEDEQGSAGEVSSFGALCTALSATIGTGNIIGVATAICVGGPGALFWMIAAAFFGMATKYAEGLLAVKYRRVDKDGHVLGGPFFYIENGMGRKWKWLARLFALFAVLAGLLGIGTMTQVNGITSAAANFFSRIDRTVTLPVIGVQTSLVVMVTGVIVTVCAALVIIGGISRISKVAEILVPFMAILYVASALLLILSNLSGIPAAISLVVKSAFDIRAVGGGLSGIACLSAMRYGVARGIFSNESGLGSAPIAAAAARTREPVRQGLVCMTGTFIDTIVICTMTGLSIILTGAYQVEGLEGSAVTAYAFGKGLPIPEQGAQFILMICLMFFAFTTILGWDYYAERSLEYLVGGRKRVVRCYRWLYILAVLTGPYLTVQSVFSIADIFNGLMAFPNLIALIALSGVVKRETGKYFKKLKDQKTWDGAEKQKGKQRKEKAVADRLK